MSCDELRPLLAGLLDGELEPAEEDVVRAHLAGCPGCAHELEAQREVALRVRAAAGPPGPSPEAWRELERALAGQLAAEAPPRSAPRWLRPALTLAALAASIAAALWLGGVLLEPPHSMAVERLPVSYLQFADPRLPRARPTSRLPRLVDVEGFEAARAALTDDAVAVLASHGLVQVPTSLQRPVDHYPLAVEPGSPAPLITADAALLLYGGAAGRAAVALEEAVVVPGLRELVALLARELAALEDEGRTRAVRRAARLARERVAVAASLVGVDPLLPAEARASIEEEVALVRAAGAYARSRVLGRPVDYGAFRPRGLFVEGPLADHARAAAWLSRSGFALDLARPDEARAACMVTIALARGRTTRGLTGLGLQARLEAAIEVLHGPPDELTPLDLALAIRQAVGEPVVRPSDLDPPAVLEAVLERAAAQAEARGAGLVRSREAAPLQAVLLGSTRSVEGRTLTRLSAPAVPGRTRPTSLDLLTLLGSRLAGTVTSLGAQAGADYVAALESLAPEAEVWSDPEHPVPVRASLERGRLWALAALFEPTAGPDPFLASPRYRDRALLLGLAGLNAPPAGPLGEGEPPAEGPLPEVEPLPRFYARLGFSAQRLAAAVEHVGERWAGEPDPRLARAAAGLERVARALEALRDAALDGLDGRPVAPITAEELRRFRGLLAAHAPAQVASAEDVYELTTPAGVRVLHRVVPRLDRLYLVVLDRATGRARLACGPAFAARELWTDGERLTPELAAELPSDPPAWARHVVVPRR